jgi:hypothetical protein
MPLTDLVIYSGCRQHTSGIGVRVQYFSKALEKIPNPHASCLAAVIFIVIVFKKGSLPLRFKICGLVV